MCEKKPKSSLDSERIKDKQKQALNTGNLVYWLSYI